MIPVVIKTTGTEYHVLCDIDIMLIIKDGAAICDVNAYAEAWTMFIKQLHDDYNYDVVFGNILSITAIPESKEQVEIYRR